MKKRILRPRNILILLGVTISITVLATSLIQRRGVAQSQITHQAREKKLKEIAMERDVEMPGGLHPATEYSTFEALTKEAKAVVYGRIIDAKSFFDESGDPREYGETITTEYTIEVLRVLRDKTQATTPLPGRAAPAPLTTPLKIARDGGIVYVNGHRAEVKYKGYESLKPGKQYVFFLFWSPDYKAYLLAGNISGVLMVEDDLSLKPLASSKAIREKLRGVDLESLATEVVNND